MPVGRVGASPAGRHAIDRRRSFADPLGGCGDHRPIDDWRGRSDRDGCELAATEIAVADQLAAAADLARDKAAGIPVVVIRGRGDLVTAEDGPGAAALQRARDEDLFR